MFKDDEKIVIKRILDDKDKQFLDFTYTGDTKKDNKTPNGRGNKKFNFEYKSGIYYDLENINCSRHLDTKIYFLNLGLREYESAEYKNGVRNGTAMMHMMEYRSGEVRNTFYCSFKNGIPHGYALHQGIFDDNFREHLVLYFEKGKILHHFWNTDKSRTKHLKRLEKNDDGHIYSIVSGQLDVFFTDESYIFPQDRSFTHKDFKL